MNYTVQKMQGERAFYLVRDFQNRIVCSCESKHNAELICKLLNNHT